jgi:hypothetical protein
MSIVVLSSGQEADLQRALAYLSGATRRMSVELIAVRAEDDERARDRLAAMAGSWDCVLRFVEAEAARAALVDVGMRVAAGDIVTVREDAQCVDGDWLRPFAERLGVDLPVAGDMDGARGHPGAASTNRRREATSGGVN